MAISQSLLNSMRSDAENRLPNIIEIYDYVQEQGTRGGVRGTYVLRTGGPFKASIQAKIRYPFVTDIADRIKTSSDYFVKFPVGLEIDIQSKIKDITPGNEQIFYEITEKNNQHGYRITNRYHCKKIT